MSEVWMGTQALLGVLNAVVAAYFCMLGGRSIDELKKWNLAIFGDKSNRIYGRVIAPIVFVTGNILLSLTSAWSWWYLLSYPAYLAVSTLGYGGDTTFEKIWRRALWSILFTAASLSYVFFSGNSKVIILYITQVLVGLIVAVIWGVTNPTQAPREEYVIRLSNLLFVPLMVL